MVTIVSDVSSPINFIDFLSPHKYLFLNIFTTLYWFDKLIYCLNNLVGKTVLKSLRSYLWLKSHNLKRPLKLWEHFESSGRSQGLPFPLADEDELIPGMFNQLKFVFVKDRLFAGGLEGSLRQVEFTGEQEADVEQVGRDEVPSVLTEEVRCWDF